MKYELIKKAWKVWNPLDDSFSGYPFMGSTEFLDIIYAETISQAKAYCEFEYDNYIDIRAIRSKPDDRVLFDGYETTRGNMLYLINDKKKNDKRIKALKKLPKDQLYYVQDNRNYVGNCILWWGLNSSICDIERAQKYTYDEIQVFNPRDSDIIWPVNYIDKVVNKHVDMQKVNCKLSV